MKSVVISGSRSINSLPAEAIARLNKIMELNLEILVGDAYGVDAQVQRYLKSKAYTHVTVYHTGYRPRNNAGFMCIKVAGSYTQRDELMCDRADYGLAIWDGRSRGTKRNIEQLGNRTRIINV